MIFLALFLTASAYIEIPLTPSIKSNRIRRTYYAQPGILYNEGEILYMANISIGTPLQSFNLAVDTGSSYLWVQDKSCSICSAIKNQFNSSNSSTFQNSSMNASLLVISKKYADGSFVKGFLSTDNIGIGNTNQLQATSVFMLGKNISMSHSSNYFDGIIGFGFRVLSDNNPTFMDSLYYNGKIQRRVFALFLNTLGNINEQKGYGLHPSTLEIGGFDLKKNTGSDSPVMTTIRVDDSGLWKAMADNTVIMNLNVKQNRDILFDSGTGYIIVDSKTEKTIMNLLANQYTCRTLDIGLFSCQCSSKSSMPTLSVLIQGKNLTIDPNYLWDQNNSSCILNLQSIDLDFWIFGGVFLRGLYVIHDMDKKQISFAKSIFTESGSNLLMVMFGLLALV